MSLLVITILAMLLLPLQGEKPQAKTEWRVTEQSSLTISGSSNVNEFECVSLSYDGEDTLLETIDPLSNKPVISGLVSLRASGFDCNNRIMTQDMRKTIQADKYPIIKVHFLSLQRVNSATKEQRARGVVQVALAGISRHYDIEATFVETGKDKARLKGQWEFSFSDFNMDPPTKMMGAIKVKDCLTIDFNLELQRLKGDSLSKLADN